MSRKDKQNLLKLIVLAAILLNLCGFLFIIPRNGPVGVLFIAIVSGLSAYFRRTYFRD